MPTKKILQTAVTTSISITSSRFLRQDADIQSTARGTQLLGPIQF